MAKSSVMSSKLVHNAYGKSGVRLTKVVRGKDHQDLIELTANVQLEGDFEDSYSTGDNAKVVATDSMKNTIYVLASEHPLDDIETFAKCVAKHFLDKYSHVAKSTVHLVQDLWIRIPLDGIPHPHAFVSGGNEKRSTTVSATRENLIIEAGIEELVVAKTTNSQFWGFIRDEYTTLPETRDRIMATAIEARWIYAQDPVDFNKSHQQVRTIILDVFARHESLAVQQTLYEMGKEILAALSEIEEVTITMPNQHRIAFNLEPLGHKNKNEIFYPIDEPYGLITGTVRRSE